MTDERRPVRSYSTHFELDDGRGGARSVEDGYAETVRRDGAVGKLDIAEAARRADDTYSEGASAIGFDFGVSDTNVDHGFSYFEVDAYND